MGDERHVIVTGPNHALHFVLTLLTCGLWLIPWLLIALGDRRRVRVFDEQGREQGPQYEWLGRWFIDDNGSARWGNIVGTVVAVFTALIVLAVLF